ncbi:PTS sugar transporter subunit IIA [Alicyclobacillus fastidiosus]|uniref:PTS sugar transporter subunit IIA n=1 Tax=Alicyclobacillus fastidiosus TaxID=392011 RepID=A0ABV5AAD6_9BACL|nr:PTS sugar transporter subunit IIA [Alicyclobacillus fastidiosus]WEH07672.1 PTS sugar transporter subunit IIA [Alicyclobacillus fastidiosus]
MIGILIVTHGHLSEAFMESVAMLVSDTALTRAVTFTTGEGIEDLDRSVRVAIDDLRSSDGVLALVDLPGGSPARIVGTILLEHERMELVTGVNLPMLVEVLMMRNSLSLSDLVDHAVACGAEGIVNVGKLMKSTG